jgi:hypothetical protein
MGCPWASPPSRRDDSWIGPATTLWLHQACGSRPSSGSITGAAGTWNAAVLAIRTALETVGAEFIADNGGGQGVRLRKQTGEPFGARPHIPSCPFITSSRICESPRGPNGRSRGPPLDRRRCGLSSPVRTRKPGPKPRGSSPAGRREGRERRAIACLNSNQLKSRTFPPRSDGRLNRSSPEKSPCPSPTLGEELKSRPRSSVGTAGERSSPRRPWEHGDGARGESADVP